MHTLVRCLTRPAHLAAAALSLAGLAPATAQVDDETAAMIETLLDGADQGARFDIPDADALLARLETARAEIGTLRASLTYRRSFAIAGDTQIRVGELWFDNDTTDADGRTRFAVRFDKLVVGERLEQRDQLFVFDGEWLVEKESADRRFTKRQVAPPGSTFDPLRIGEGPFPVPLGQKPADIVERYIAELRPPTEGLDPDDGLNNYAQQGLVQLRLTPKPEFEAVDDFAEIRLWYDPRTTAMLPKLARTETAIGDVSLVVVNNPRLNTTLPDEVFDTTTPPRSEGWNVTVSPYRQTRPTGMPIGTPAEAPAGTGSP